MLGVAGGGGGGGGGVGGEEEGPKALQFLAVCQDVAESSLFLLLLLRLLHCSEQTDCNQQLVWRNMKSLTLSMLI